MKKNATLILLFLLVYLQPFAGNIDSQTALTASQNFLSINNISLKGLRLTHQEYRNGQPVYYVFTGTEGGFVILSASDNVQPVIGYDSEQRFEPANLPEQLRAWLKFSADQIEYAREQQLESGTAITARWNSLRSGDVSGFAFKGTKDVSPLLPCTWDQGKYYNEFCPAAAGGDGGHVWVGCVATAMAQVMFYYRYPETGIGTHTYTHPQYGVQTVDYGATTYEWTGMLNSLHTSNFPVAKLSYHCAVSINMDFGPDGSGANTGSVPGALVNNFGYDPAAYYHQKFFYTPAAWIDLIKSNLDEKHPVLYSGHPGNGEAGHCWVIDGYQGADYFHCNWGWSGSSNGYYYIDALNPAAGGTNFNYGQGAAFDLYPPAGYPAFCTGQTLISHTTGTIEDGSWVLPYAASSNCSWLIDPADSVNSLKLNFHRFETESANDVLTVYAGSTPAAPVLGTFSGSSLPPVIQTNSGQILITFTSDASTQAGGWYLTYSSVLPEYCSNNTSTANTGTISDGSGPASYQANSTCTWIIQPNNAAALKLSFTSFDLEQGNDFLKVYDLGTQELLANLTGNSLPAEIIAGSGAMYLEFRTNSSVQGQGWTANYAVLGVGMEESSFLPDLRVYPMPADDYLILNPGSVSGELNISLFTIDGRLVLEERGLYSRNEPIHLNVSRFESGIYYLRIFGKEGSRSIKVTIE